MFGSLARMSDDPTQTTPEGEERERVGLPGEGGAEIPVPEREDVFAALRKAARTHDSKNQRGVE